MKREINDRVATLTFDRPKRKNSLTFEIYDELRAFFLGLAHEPGIRAVVLSGEGDDFCSGGDVLEIIEALTRRPMPELLAFTRMTGEVVKAMRACPQPIVAAVDGACAGAGAMLALASDLRLGTARSEVAFLFVRVGLSGADMGACAMLPRVIGQGRAAELLYTGRAMHGEEAANWGFFNRLVDPSVLLGEAQTVAHGLANGPTFAHAVTKRLLHQAWAMGLDEEIDAEAQAQAICMQTQDFKRAFAAFATRRTPEFSGD
jgi:enoyl-CoA hydratase/carnithine racemase